MNQASGAAIRNVTTTIAGKAMCWWVAQLGIITIATTPEPNSTACTII